MVRMGQEVALENGSFPSQRYDQRREVVGGASHLGVLGGPTPTKRGVPVLHDVPACVPLRTVGFPWPDDEGARPVLRARFEVMDGRQRLTALMDFYQGRLHLTGLQHWPELDGRTYSTLPSSIRDGIDRRYLSSIILLNETAADPEQAAFLKKLVFERLNSGGVRLSGQETRDAVYDGPLNDLCLRLSRITELRSVLGTPLDPIGLADLTDADDESDDDGGGLELGW